MPFYGRRVAEMVMMVVMSYCHITSVELFGNKIKLTGAVIAVFGN